MSKKKIVAIVLFIFLGLFMFTFANPGSGELKPVTPPSDETEPDIKEPDDGEDEGDDIPVVEIIDRVPVITITPAHVRILLGADYDVMTGVNVTDDNDLLSATPSITDTTSLPIGRHEIVYTTRDSRGNTATASRTIVVLDPQADNDNDGFTNEEELERPTEPTDPTKPVGPENPLVPTNPTNPENPDSHPETYAPTIALKGNNPYIMLQNREYVEAGVVITVDPHDKITTEKDVVITGTINVNEVGEYTLTYTITDRYGKKASVTRTIKVLDPQADNDNDGFTNEEELEKPMEPTDPTKPMGPENPLVPTNPTDPEDPNNHPQTYAPTIIVLGNNPFTLEVKNDYVDAGVRIVLDPHDKVTTEKDLITRNLVKQDVLGNYFVNYAITDRYNKTATASRKVNVVDTTKPVITLNNKAVVEMERQSNYVEFGAIVTDNYDANITVTIDSSSVNTNVLGTYTVKYNATDSSGNKADEVTRTVIVVRSSFDKTIASIRATLNPTTYDRGTTNYGTLVVTATDNDGTTHVLDANEYTVTGWDSSLAANTESSNRNLTITLNSNAKISTTVGYTIVRSDYDKTIKSLTAVLAKDVYQRGEAMSAIVVTRIDNDNTVTVLKSNEYTLTGFSTTTVGGPYTVRVSHAGLTATDTYNVVRSDYDKTIKSLTAVLAKDVYQRGEAMSAIVVTRIDNDNTVTVLKSNEYTLTGFSTTTVGGPYTVRVSHAGLTATDTYSVVRSNYDKTLNRIEASLTKVVYNRGEAISTLVVTAYDNDGTSYDVTALSSHNFDSSTLGNKTLTVTYQGKTDTVNYAVTAIDVIVDSSKPIADAEGKKAEPGDTVDYEIRLSATGEVILPTYTIIIDEDMTLICPTNRNVTCKGNTMTWRPTSINEKLNYSAVVAEDAQIGSTLTTTIKDGNEVIKEIDTNIEATVNVVSSETKPTSMDVVLTLDVSGSMWEGTNCDRNGNNCKSTKIKDLVAISKDFVANLNAKNTNGSTIKLTIITFGRSKETVSCNSGLFGTGIFADTSNCYETVYTGILNSSTLASINTTINGIKPYSPNKGGTPLYGAINSALTVINNSNLENQYLVILGDGTPTDTDSYGAVKKLKATKANVFSIGFGVDNNIGAQTVLKSIINNNNNYFSASDADSLQDSFNTISQNISSVAIQTVNGNIRSSATNATKLILSYKDRQNKKQVVEISNITNPTQLGNHNVTIVNGKFVWDISKYAGCKEFEMTVQY